MKEKGQGRPILKCVVSYLFVIVGTTFDLCGGWWKLFPAEHFYSTVPRTVTQKFIIVCPSWNKDFEIRITRFNTIASGQLRVMLRLFFD